MSWESDRLAGELRDANRQLAEANRHLREANLPPAERAALHAERAQADRGAVLLFTPLAVYAVVWALAHKLVGPRVDGAFWWLLKNAVLLVFAAVPIALGAFVVLTVGGFVWRLVRERRDA